MKWERFVSPPVITVLLASCFVYYVTVFVFIDDYLGLETSAGSLNALTFTFLASLTIFSLIACVLTDPGRVPPGFVPDLEGSHQDSIKSIFFGVSGLIVHRGYMEREKDGLRYTERGEL